MLHITTTTVILPLMIILMQLLLLLLQMILKQFHDYNLRERETMFLLLWKSPVVLRLAIRHTVNVHTLCVWVCVNEQNINSMQSSQACTVHWSHISLHINEGRTQQPISTESMLYMNMSHNYKYLKLSQTLYTWGKMVLLWKMWQWSQRADQSGLR